VTDVAQLSTLALDVWRFGLAERGEHLFAVVRRLEQKMGTMCDPQAVSVACRELVRAGYADRSALGYRRRMVGQCELALGGET
jgi:hypothetical protein